MQKLEKFLNDYPERGFFLLLILALPAFFINLGLLPLFADEPTRANVALEMILSRNYSVPTIGGEYYYNKPPFYNWILAAFYHSTGSYSEFVTRLPAVISMFLFAITIFFFVRYFIEDKRIALLSGILFLVNGRMLIYDSMLGHIDIFYSWLTFSSFMLIYLFFQKKQWFLLFFTSYFITAVAFLCKGMPSIAFQGFTIIALLAFSGNLKKLFSWQHILCGIICLAVIGTYFLNYYQYNPNLEGYFSTIWEQSSKRTATQFGLWPTFLHIILFPFEHAGHLFPASLLLLFCVHKNFIPGIKASSFLTFIALTFIANIIVYWLSPQTRPRYLLMLYPLLFIIWSHAYYTYRHHLPAINKAFEAILLGLAVLITVSVPTAFFLGLALYVPYLTWKIFLIFTMCFLCTFLVYKFKNQKILAFVGLLLTVRLAFSLFILPHRAYHKKENNYKKAAIEMGLISRGKPFYLYQYHPGELDIPFHDRLIFYIQRTRMQQVKFTESTTNPGYYFTFDRELKGSDALLIKKYQHLKFYEVK